ncbi:PilZ domain-containing protein [Desulfovibrio sp. OttesenSCG-928-C06]|nr:PilZ domain-containing protein [Desulfovibrio sp. OttesenSCG-928-C06]
MARDKETEQKTGGKPDAASERRRAPRVQLDNPCFATLHIEGMESYNVMLTDIGAQGAQVLLPPQIEPSDIPEDARLFLYGFSDSLEQLKDKEIQGSIAWRGLRNCGIAFTEELDLSMDEFVTFCVKL